MSHNQGPILVFGATGQQGGSVATALLKAGWQVRALVRDPASPKAARLAEAGAELVAGSFDDAGSIRSAMAGAYGVFSVQPSSGQGALYNVTDEDEVRYGTAVADVAVAAGVKHLVYASASGVGDQPIGLPHFDTKAQIVFQIEGEGGARAAAAPTPNADTALETMVRCQFLTGPPHAALDGRTPSMKQRSRHRSIQPQGRPP